jgi:hypothetical protein
VFKLLLSALLLFCSPGEVPCQFVVLSELLNGIELAGKRHFIVGGVYTGVAGATDKNALIEQFPRVVLSEKAAPVYFAWYQVVECQRQFAGTQTADARPVVSGICCNVVLSIFSIHVRYYD